MPMFLKRLHIIMMFLLFANTAYAGSAWLNLAAPTDDSYIDSQSPSTNYGSSSMLYFRTPTFVDLRYPYLRFDTTSISNHKIFYAEIQLYLSYIMSWGPVSVCSVDSSWTEGTITWSNAPSVSCMGDPYLDLSWPNNSYKSTDVTKATQKMVDTGHYGYAFRGYSSGGNIYLVEVGTQSKEGANKPRLNIRYSNSPPAATSITYPSNGATIIGSTVNLIWDAVIDPDPVGYGWQLATDSGFANIIASGNVTTVSSGAIAVTNGQTYYARARSGYLEDIPPYNLYDPSVWSSTVQFTALDTNPIDINLDGIIDIFDLRIVALHFGEITAPPYPRYDVNTDGTVDILDLRLVAGGM